MSDPLELAARCETRGETVELSEVAAVLRRLAGVEAERDALHDEVTNWRASLTAVMPPNFKDWHQNSPVEWPKVAARVITSQREEIDRWQTQVANQAAVADALRADLQEVRELSMWRKSEIERLTRERDKAVAEVGRLTDIQIDQGIKVCKLENELARLRAGQGEHLPGIDPGSLESQIESPHNACQHRHYCRSLKAAYRSMVTTRALAASAPRAGQGDAVATIKRGPDTKWGHGVLLLRWESGAALLPPGEHKLFAPAPSAEPPQVTVLAERSPGDACPLRVVFRSVDQAGRLTVTVEAPAPSAPLTKNQIDFILGDSFLAANGSVYSTRVYDFVAAIERAHGITPKESGNA